MRLLSLKLANFRCFEHCELDLNVVGLVGITGMNGAGKSTLLEAIDYALYGVGRGNRMEPPHRDGTRPASCRVDLELVHGGRHVAVSRGPTTAELTIDGTPSVSTGQEELTRATTQLLGVGRQTFATTFYARQHEIEALSTNDHARRRAQLEALLGLTSLRDAVNEAQAQAREQRTVVSTLAAEAADIKAAEREVERVEAEARERAPAAESARERRATAQSERAQAWQALEKAQERLNDTAAIERRAALAEQALETAQSKEESVRTDYEKSLAAHAEMESLKKLASSATDLVAAERKADLKRQAAETAAQVRKQAADASVVAASASKVLADAADPGPELEKMEHDLDQARSDLADETDSVIRLTKEVQTTKAAEQAAGERRDRSKRAAALDEELARLRPLSAADQTDREAVREWETDRGLATAERDREAAHRAEVERDGEHARCPRCRREYGDDHGAILAGFTAALDVLDVRIEKIDRELTAARERTTGRVAALRRLPQAMAAREALDKPSSPDEDLEADHDAATRARERADADLARATLRKGELERQTAQHAKRAAALRKAKGRFDELERDARAKAETAAALEREANVVADASYDRAAHEELRSRRDEATQADLRCRELRTTAERRVELEAELTRCTTATSSARETARSLLATKAERAGDGQARDDAKAAYEKAGETVEAADLALKEAEAAAVRDSSAVREAGAALARAQEQDRQLKAERLEMRYREVVADLLNRYRARAQDAAVPGLAQETAGLLQRVTSGRYSDVEVTDDGRLTIAQHGEQRPLRRFSGGEQDLANLCLRIALSQSVARRSGTEAGFIILDEVLGSQHVQRRKPLIDALKELDGEFQQVLIISHFDDFLDHCAVQVVVDGDSERPSTAVAVTN